MLLGNAQYFYGFELRSSTTTAFPFDLLTLIKHGSKTYPTSAFSALNRTNILENLPVNY